MKASLYYENGSPDVIRLGEIEKPQVTDDAILVKVEAASLNPADRHIMHGAPFIFRKLFRIPSPSTQNPGRLGRDVAGVVEEVGKDVKEFKPGDQVFGNAVGAFAEYVCGPASKFTLKPANVSFEEAASAPVAAFTALQGLRDKGKLQPGQKVLINGASGGVGTFAVQIAKALGAEVTAVCSTNNLEMVRAIGADHVVDYTKEDFTNTPQRYDMVFDCVWTKPISCSRRILAPGGVYVLVGGPVSSGVARFMGRVASARAISAFSNRKFLLFMAKTNQADLVVMRDLMAAGKVKPVIDRRYSLSDVPEAIRYLEAGHARGKIIITVAS
jgi:NADPH:quinone reductase-like Zn-dependent oxidoreductase